MLRFWDEEETLISWKVHPKHFPFAQIKMVIQIGTDNWTKDKKKAVILAHVTVFSVASRRNLGTLVQLAILRGPKSRALVGVG